MTEDDLTPARPAAKTPVRPLRYAKSRKPLYGQSRWVAPEELAKRNKARSAYAADWKRRLQGAERPAADGMDGQKD
jgi:hypothetical protein